MGSWILFCVYLTEKHHVRINALFKRKKLLENELAIISERAYRLDKELQSRNRIEPLEESSIKYAPRNYANKQRILETREKKNTNIKLSLDKINLE